MRRTTTPFTSLLSLRSVVILLSLTPAVSQAQPKSTILLKDVTKQTGITFLHTDGSSGGYYIVETVCAGLALFDYDNDGDEDIYFLNGGALKGTRFKVPPRNALYRNDGNFKFTDVTKESGLGDKGHALGVAAADYDSDGDLDVYVTNFGPNVLFRNNGDGTFTDVTREAGVADGSDVGAGANFLDADKDGDLDLFVSSYVNFTYEGNVPNTASGYPTYAGPKAYKPTPDSLYRNNGDGTFTDISEVSGISKSPGTGMGTVCLDYDNDGDTDIYVCNDMMQNFLFTNDGTGKFEEVGLVAGAGYDMNGDEMGSMGVGCGDYDNDGHLDLYVTAYQQQFPSLYRNIGDGLFEDVTFLTGAGAGTIHTVTWGNEFVDFDNDGDRDLFVALGHMMDNIELWDKRASYLARNILFMNTNDGKFVSVSDTSGDGMIPKLSSRGAAFDDLDNDGDVDVVVSNSRGAPTILRNDSPSKGHWLQVKLRGAKMNRDGVGARVKVVAGDLTLIDEVHSGRGYQSHYGMRLHFGLGDREKIDRVEVRWIGGGADVFENIAADQLVTLTEGGPQTAARSQK
ncbi:MAG: CRTAC1 family protein [Phycisphaerales bacterium]|nr:MAG: CRTAC1 family protein [Phycisphaerales bacterium]